jgi:hypothetical protein
MTIKTVIEHTMTDRTVLRWCMQCGLHVGKDGKIDLDFYTARQYLRIMDRPTHLLCEHERQVEDSKEELLKKVEAINTVGSMKELFDVFDNMKELLKEVIRRLP